MNLLDFYPGYPLSRVCTKSSPTSSSAHAPCRLITHNCVFVHQLATCLSGEADWALPSCRCPHIPGRAPVYRPTERTVRYAMRRNHPYLSITQYHSRSPPRARRALRPSRPRITEGICWLIASARRACCSRRAADLLSE